MNDLRCETSNPSLRAHAGVLRALLVPFIQKRVDAQDVDDVLQDVFVRIQRGLVDLRDRDKLVAWVYQVARNAIVDHARRTSARRAEASRHDDPATPPDQVDQGSSSAVELAAVLGHFITKLPDAYREALELIEIQGITQADAARRLGLSVSGMKSRVQRARAQLRDLLEGCCDIELDPRGAVIDVEPRNRPPELPHCCARPASPARSR